MATLVFDMKRQIKVSLIRHGATPGNATRRYIGRGCDESLSLEGRQELLQCKAQASVEFTRWRQAILQGHCKYVTSPMKRCIETGEVLIDGIEPLMIHDLEEMDFGIFEGHTYRELSQNPAYQAWIDSGGLGEIPQGESQSRFVKRTWDAFLTVLIACGEESKEEMLCICHGGTIMAILSALSLGNYFDFQVKNGRGYQIVLEIEEDRVHAISYNSLFSGIYS